MGQGREAQGPVEGLALAQEPQFPQALKPPALAPSPSSQAFEKEILQPQSTPPVLWVLPRHRAVVGLDSPSVSWASDSVSLPLREKGMRETQEAVQLASVVCYKLSTSFYTKR